MIWITFWLFLSVISAITGITAGCFTNWIVGVLISAGISGFIAGVTIYLGWSQVPENWEWTISEFGKYSQTWKSGLHFLFPYFGFMKVDAQVFMGQQQMSLAMDDGQPDKPGRGSVDFVDVSAPVEANVFFTVVDAEKATYSIDDVLKKIENIMDDCVRSYLAHFRMAEAISLRVYLDLVHIMNGELPYDSATGMVSKKAMDFKRSPDYDMMQELERVEQWKSMLDNCGVRIDQVIITDIVLSDSIVQQREKVLAAEREAEAAIYTKMTLERLAEGHAAEIERLKVQGLNPIQAAEHIQTLKKFDKVQDLVIIEGGSGGAGFGAHVGAGMNATQRHGGGQGGHRQGNQGGGNRGQQP